VKKGILYSITVLALVLGLALPMATPVVVEAQEPPGCTGNYFFMDVTKDQMAVHQGDVIKYTVKAGNKADGGVGCDMDDVVIQFFQPAADGTATGSSAWLEPSPGHDFPADGTGDKTYLPAAHSILNYVVSVNPTVTKVTAKAVATGRLMDVPGGTYPNVVEKPISVLVLHPCVNVTKTADTAFSKVGDVITYTIKVCNCGDVDLTKVSIIDDMLGNLTASFATTLPKGTCENHTFPHTVTASDSDPLVNTVTVHYQDYTAYAVSATSTASVPLVEPSLTITKTGPATSKVGDTITYTFVITNTSPDTPLNRKSVTDTKLGDITASFPATLAIAESKTVTKTYTVKTGDPDPLVNVVTAIYIVPTLGNEVTATDSHSVDLGEKPPPPVGWETYPINKLAVLAPWIALLAAIMVSAGLLVLRRRRT
jgi:uncharacterized repeat protein (TIGR01451 family)